MSCKYNRLDTGKCDLWDEETGPMFEHIENLCDEEGHCIVNEDEDPTMSCEDYEEL